MAAREYVLPVLVGSIRAGQAVKQPGSSPRSPGSDPSPKLKEDIDNPLERRGKIHARLPRESQCRRYRP
jgi:hypothetical protein